MIDPSSMINLPRAFLIHNVVLTNGPLIIRLKQRRQLVITPRRRSRLTIRLTRNIRRMTRHLIKLLSTQSVLISVKRHTILSNLNIRINHISIRIRLLISQRRTHIMTQIILRNRIRSGLQVNILIRRLGGLIMNHLINRRTTRNVNTLRIISKRRLIGTGILMSILTIPINYIIKIRNNNKVTRQLRLLYRVPNHFRIMSNMKMRTQTRINRKITNRGLGLNVNNTTTMNTRMRLTTTRTIKRILGMLQTFMTNTRILMSQRVQRNLIRSNSSHKLLTIRLLLYNNTLITLNHIKLIMNLNMLFRHNLNVISKMINKFKQLSKLHYTGRDKRMTLTPMTLRQTPNMSNSTRNIMMISGHSIHNRTTRTRRNSRRINRRRTLNINNTLLAIQYRRTNMLT